MNINLIIHFNVSLDLSMTRCATICVRISFRVNPSENRKISVSIIASEY